jgi:hypothetical protein
MEAAEMAEIEGGMDEAAETAKTEGGMDTAAATAETKGGMDASAMVIQRLPQAVMTLASGDDRVWL